LRQACNHCDLKDDKGFSKMRFRAQWKKGGSIECENPRQ